MRELRLYQFV